jgi:hypothetical protein
MNKDRMIDKIKKLFALASNAGATGNEAENAMRMANKLLAKHAIEMHELHDNDDVGMDRHQWRNMPWTRTVISGVASLYNCTYIMRQVAHRKYVHLMIGTESNRTTAAIVIEHLIDQISRECKGKGNAFRNSAATALHKTCMRLKKERDGSKEEVIPGTGLVPVDITKRQEMDVADYIAAHFRGLRKQITRSKVDRRGEAYGNTLNPGARVSGSGQRRLT